MGEQGIQEVELIGLELDEGFTYDDRKMGNDEWVEII